ncbi:VOC family protein [Streptomyces morookaense]|uniref:VOC family protein n=1 Tax=Streptomyces TaxID=1883 RepID=UPI001D107AC6|nr:VOC family protein [Streptomyces sp. ET3-23]MCC2274472.1 VOC family protein [Streptomyces sp. ET3-23]
MPHTRTACLPGVPSWVSLTTRSLDAAMDFYGPLLGWRFEPAQGRCGAGARALAGETAIAGINAVAPEWELPVTWTTYFGIESADAAVARIQERGGTVAVGPLESEAGRLALAADPAGAAFGLWECHAAPRGNASPLLGGTAVWVELRTRDAFEAAFFYDGVLDWDRRRSAEYVIRWEEDRVVLDFHGSTVATLYGGAVEATADPRLRPRWTVFFSVPDTEATLRTAEKLGGQTIDRPSRTAFGRMATLRDPEGGVFCVVSGHS